MRPGFGATPFVLVQSEKALLVQAMARQEAEDFGSSFLFNLTSQYEKQARPRPNFLGPLLHFQAQGCLQGMTRGHHLNT